MPGFLISLHLFNHPFNHLKKLFFVSFHYVPGPVPGVGKWYGKLDFLTAPGTGELNVLAVPVLLFKTAFHCP